MSSSFRPDRGPQKKSRAIGLRGRRFELWKPSVEPKVKPQGFLDNGEVRNKNTMNGAQGDHIGTAARKVSMERGQGTIAEEPRKLGATTSEQNVHHLQATEGKKPGRKM